MVTKVYEYFKEWEALKKSTELEELIKFIIIYIDLV